MMLKKSMNELIEIINNNLDGIIKSSPLNTKLEESMQYSLDLVVKEFVQCLYYSL